MVVAVAVVGVDVAVVAFLAVRLFNFVLLLALSSIHPCRHPRFRKFDVDEDGFWSVSELGALASAARIVFHHQKILYIFLEWFQAQELHVLVNPNACNASFKS